VLDLFEILEIPAYFIGFWAFILSRSFRENIIVEWRERGHIGKFLTLLEMASSFLVGVVLPTWLILYLVIR
jgi:hypothetical protein